VPHACIPGYTKSMRGCGGVHNCVIPTMEEAEIGRVVAPVLEIRSQQKEAGCDGVHLSSWLCGKYK
jgi:hypothetical protein